MEKTLYREPGVHPAARAQTPERLTFSETQVLPLLGESAWHSLIEDPRIASESERHYQELTQVLQQHLTTSDSPLHILEIGCYAHTTGYALARELGARVTLFDLSQHSLRLGKTLGHVPGTDETNPRLVIGDFHQLPFADSSFNVVYICSALHHTWDYPQVLREMMRVLTPGGILFIENEPTLRSLCFYKFRCNRVHELSPLETHLHQAGLLTTIAEPYLGSRPESLFGMVENQCLPLPALLEITEEACEVVSLFLSTAFCMGAWEAQLAQHRGNAPWELAAEIEAHLLAGLRAAQPLLTPNELGAGRSLPTESEIHALAQRVGRELHELPQEENDEFILRLAQIFGAPLQLVARKKAAFTSESTPDLLALAENFNQKHEQLAGIYNGFPAEVRALLTRPSLLPDVQRASEQELNTLFPSTYWRFTRGQYALIALDGLTHDLRSVVNLTPWAELQLPETALRVPTWLVLRLFAACEKMLGFRIEVWGGGRCLAQHDAYQPESVLLRAQLTPDLMQASQGRVALRLTVLTSHTGEAPTLALSHLGLYALSA